MQLKFAGEILSIGLAVLLTACTTTSGEYSWSNPEYIDRPIGKTMVLGVGKTAEISRYYESMFVDNLTALGITADSMHQHISREELVTEDEIVKILTDNQFDSIIVTRMTSEKERIRAVAVNQYPDHYWHYYGFYNYAYHQAEIEEYIEYELETNLYDVNTRKLVWLGQKQITNDRSEKDGLELVINSAIQTLQSENMVSR
ncbi:hypothetical protein P4E94_11905 [Pontiellaceae bacterium B12219]|nr:hypothetical protein [Pontiellaceae bacterium B12219]